MSNKGTLLSAAMRAKETFNRNVDTIVAGFLIRHPDVLPGEIELVMRAGDDRSLHITIERKGGIRYPEELPSMDTEGGDPAVNEYNRGVIHGWNSALKAFHDVNPPFVGQEMRSEPTGFESKDDDVTDVECRLVGEVVGG